MLQFHELTDEQKQAWFSAPVVAFDIETRTSVPDGHPAAGITDFGLSFNAPVNDVSFYTPELGAVVVNLRGKTYWEYWDKNPDNWKSTQRRLQLIPEIEFIIRVLGGQVKKTAKGHQVTALTEPPIRKTIIGHNVIFDLRQVGGQYGFTLPVGTMVWDTMVMGIRMMLGELDVESFGLLGLAERLGLLVNKPASFVKFYAAMKEQREFLDNLGDALGELKPDHALWEYYYSHFAERPEKDEEAAQWLIQEYVAADSELPWLIFETQNNIARELTHNHFRWGLDRRLALKWPEIGDILHMLQRRLRIAANHAIVGVKVDYEYLQEKITGYRELIEAKVYEVTSQRNPAEPEGYQERFQTLLYYDMVLAKVQGEGSFSDVKRKYYWQTFDAVIPVFHFSWHPRVRDDEKEKWGAFWADFLRNLDPNVKGKTLADMGLDKTLIVPRIDFVSWTIEECYSDLSPALATYRAVTTVDWLAHLYKTPKRIDPHAMVNKQLWQPYYLYVVSQMPLPTSHEFKYNWSLTTKRFQKEVRDFTKKYKAEPEDYAEFALKHHALSCGNKALDFFLDENGPYAERGAVLAPYRQLMQAIANLDRAVEFRQHSACDGWIHSIIIPRTRTGRDSSTSPNLQNIKMEEFSGVFVAPEGFWFGELDYANAENKMGAAIAGDSAMAYATESGDFHSAMAEIYFPDLWAAADKDKRKYLRNKKGKPATFAIPYGVGHNKLSVMIGMLADEARELMENRKKRFPQVEVKKEQVIENAKKRAAAGVDVTWISLWSGERVQVPKSMEGKREYDYYKTWNYLQQGGVAAMMHRAMIDASEWLETNGFQTYIALDIHDSFIVAINIEEYFATEERQVLSNLLKIMCNQVPASLTHRTNPPIHFVAEMGYENHTKWGFQNRKGYPFPPEEFVNQWGKFTLSDTYCQSEKQEKWEAPTWVGPVHLGWTLEAEMAGITQTWQAQQALQDNGSSSVLQTNRPWQEMNEIYGRMLEMQERLKKLLPSVSETFGLASLDYINNAGQAQRIGPFDFPNKMAAARELWHKGHLQKEFPNLVGDIAEVLTLEEDLLQCLQVMAEWKKQYGDILNVPNARKPVNP